MSTDPRFMYIGKRIKELRIAKGLTQKELAAKCKNGVSRPAITSYEIGSNKNPTLTNLYAIADALEVPVTELFLKEEQQYPTYQESIANEFVE